MHPPENSESATTWFSVLSFSSEPMYNTWFILLPYLYTVMPLHLKCQAGRNACLTSSIVESWGGRLTVFDTALSVYFWNATWILMCHSGGISRAVTNSLLTSSGISSIFWIEPVSAILRRALRSRNHAPLRSSQRPGSLPPASYLPSHPGRKPPQIAVRSLRNSPRWCLWFRSEL